MTLDDLDLFGTPATAPNPAAVARKCGHPRPYRRVIETGDTVCSRCGHTFDPDRQRRGRRARSRGLAIQRQQLTKAGLENIPYNKPGHDGRSSMFAAEVKSGGAYPERLDRWLRAVPATAEQTPILIVSDAPGPGHRRRSLVVLTLEDWVSLHGKDGL